MPTKIPRILGSRITLSLGLMLCVLTQPACGLLGKFAKKSVEVERLLTPLAEADTTQLITMVNKLVDVQSIRAKVDIQFEDTSFATAGIAEKYRTADGQVIVQRPGKVYLIVQAPLIASQIAQMTSDGERFRIAIFQGDEKYKKFFRGTNTAAYSRLDGNSDATGKGKSNQETQAVKALSNLRPQHLTDAVLIRPIDTHAPGVVYARSEFFQSEKDPNSKKRVVRGYYFLDELQTQGDGSARLLRRFWFNRVNAVQFARVQTFDDDGILTTDVVYSDFKPVSEQNVTLPTKISLTRPQDHYEISLTYQSPESVVLDKEYEPDVFVLQNKTNLPEVDLDSAKKP
jgi:hypothetical protein